MVALTLNVLITRNLNFDIKIVEVDDVEVTISSKSKNKLPIKGVPLPGCIQCPGV